MNNIDWGNAPEGAEFYALGEFRRAPIDANQEFFDGEGWRIGAFDLSRCRKAKDYQERPQTQPKPPVINQEALNKYSRQVIGLDGKACQIDVYRVLVAFEVDSHPIAHSIKKLLAPGMRHSKSREQDLREAIASIEAELLMMEHGK